MTSAKPRNTQAARTAIAPIVPNAYAFNSKPRKLSPMNAVVWKSYEDGSFWSADGPGLPSAICHPLTTDLRIRKSTSGSGNMRGNQI